MNWWIFEDNPQWFEQCCEIEPKRYFPQLQKCPATETGQNVPRQLKNFRENFQSELGKAGGEYLSLLGVVAICSALAFANQR